MFTSYEKVEKQINSAITKLASQRQNRAKITRQYIAKASQERQDFWVLLSVAIVAFVVASISGAKDLALISIVSSTLGIIFIVLIKEFNEKFPDRKIEK